MDASELKKDGPNYAGKLRSNFVGTEFVIFDKGVNPKVQLALLIVCCQKQHKLFYQCLLLVQDAGSGAMGNVDLMTVRQELGAVLYQSNILGHRGPRKMTSIVPTVGNCFLCYFRLPMAHDTPLF